MTKQKNLFKIMAIAIMVIMVVAACKNKPTQVASFSSEEIVEPPFRVDPINPPNNPVEPTEETYKITIPYSEVVSALTSKGIDLDAVKASDQETLDTIWKTMVNDGSERITGLTGAINKTYSHLADKSIYFDADADVKYRGNNIDWNDRKNGEPTIKTFKKALIVKNGQTHTIAAIYQANAYNGQNQQLLKTFSPANGGAELLFINPNKTSKYTFEGGVGYDMTIKYGAPSVDADFSQYTQTYSAIDDYWKRHEVGGLRFYRVDASK